MLSYLGKSGDQFVNVMSSQSLLGVHAVRQAGGNLALVLINKDLANSFAANVSVSGHTPATSSTDYFYGQPIGSGNIAQMVMAAGATFTRTVPLCLLTTVVMRPKRREPVMAPSEASSG